MDQDGKLKVLLIGPDTKKNIGNLALMKYYTYHKNRGDEVGFNIRNPDRVYVSILFRKNKWMGKQIKDFSYPNAEIFYGGPGYDPKIKLPDEVFR